MKNIPKALNIVIIQNIQLKRLLFQNDYEGRTGYERAVVHLRSMEHIIGMKVEQMSLNCYHKTYKYKS